MPSRSPSSFSLALALLVTVLAGHALAANDEPPKPDDALYYHIFRDYDPSAIGAYICGVIYLLVGSAHCYFMIRHRSWWSWCLPLGALGSGAGLIVRGMFIGRKSDSVGLYAISQSFVVCMPALFLAYNYMLYVRLILHNIGAKYSLIKPTIIAKVFVGVDVVTFIVQAASSPLQINDDKDLANIGTTIFQAGVILQSISYYIFCFFLVWTHYKVRKTQVGVTGREVWWIPYWCLYFSSLLIVIRSIYRIAEALTPARTGVHNSEGYLYGFDVVPLILCTIPYLYRWPATLLGQDRINHEIPLASVAGYKPAASSSLEV